MDKCHSGDCGICRVEVSKTCSCGATTQRVLCHKEVSCQKRCTRMRNCGKHACNKKCCTGDCPPCEEVCGKKLPCSNHKCAASCHTGPCLPCPLTLPITCACRSTSYMVPCGTEKKAPPPVCKSRCPLPSLCRHEAAMIGYEGPLPPLAVKSPSELKPIEHKCHFGACPPCSNPCGTLLACGHVCTVRTVDIYVETVFLRFTF